VVRQTVEPAEAVQRRILTPLWQTLKNPQNSRQIYSTNLWIHCVKKHQLTSAFHSIVITGSKINFNNAKLPSPNFHCQMTSKNAEFDLHYKMPISNLVLQLQL